MDWLKNWIHQGDQENGTVIYYPNKQKQKMSNSWTWKLLNITILARTLAHGIYPTYKTTLPPQLITLSSKLG